MKLLRQRLACGTWLRLDQGRVSAWAPGHRAAAGHSAPANNSFKPNPLRGISGGVTLTLHRRLATARVGLTQALGQMGEMMEAVEQESQNTGSLKVLIIDLENCPNQLHQLPSDLTNYSRVVICYAQGTSKVPLNWLIPLSTAIAADKLKIQKMERGGKNSADFGILFLCGALMHELPQDTHFVIVSNDSDLDHAVHLLKSHSRSSERIGNVAADPPPAKPAPSDSSTPLAIYCAHLITYSKNRPAKADTLRNSIKNKFKDNPAEADKVYNSLLSNGAVKVSSNKVTYSDKKISELANR